MIFWLLAIGYIVCGVLAYGLTFAHLQRKYPSFAENDRVNDRTFSASLALTGPAAILTAIIMYEGYGFKWLILIGCLLLLATPVAQADHCAHDGYYVREYWHGGWSGDYYYRAGWYQTWHAYPKRHVDHQTYSVSIDPDKEFYRQLINKLIERDPKLADVAPKTPTTAAEVYAMRCASCHSTEAAAKAKGSDFVLNPGSLSASERTKIKERVTTTDAAKRMPPGMQLPAAETKLLTD